MPPSLRKNFVTNKNTPEDVAAARSASWMAVCHVSCWASSVILGVVSIWLRLQTTQGSEQSVFGVVGVGLWGSIPYVFAATFAIKSSKKKSYSTIRWYFASSIMSLICSVGIFAFSSLVVAFEAYAETSPKRVIVAGILSGFSLLEVVTSIVSCISCYTSIGCFDKKKDKKGGRSKENGFPRGTRIAPGDEESGHVTVMALPARQAAELFYTMYRPFFPNADFMGINRQDVSSPHDQYPEGCDLDAPVDRRRYRHKRMPRPDPREYESGYPNEFSQYIEPDNSEEEPDFPRTGHNHRSKRQGTPHRQFQDEDALVEEVVVPSKQAKLAPVLEDEQSQEKKRHSTGEISGKGGSSTDGSKTSTEQGTKSKEQKQSKTEGVKQSEGEKEIKEKTGENPL